MKFYGLFIQLLPINIVNEKVIDILYAIGSDVKTYRIFESLKILRLMNDVKFNIAIPVENCLGPIVGIYLIHRLHRSKPTMLLLSWEAYLKIEKDIKMFPFSLILLE